MEYRHPNGHIIIVQPDTFFEWHNGERLVNVPTQKLTKASDTQLHAYGFRRIVIDSYNETYWIGTPSSDLTVDGVETITYTLTPRYTSTQLRGNILNNYYRLAGEKAIEIEKQLLLWSAIQPTHQNTLDWQAAQADLKVKYDLGVAEFQAAMAQPDEASKYAALVALASNLGAYIPDTDSLRAW